MAGTERSAHSASPGDDPLRARAIEEAVAGYEEVVGRSEYPTPEVLTAAARRARTTLIDFLVAEAECDDPSRRAAMELRLHAESPVLRVPAPARQSKLPPGRLALAAGAGALAGTLLITPLTHYLLDMRDMGLLLGGPLGAGATVWLLMVASKNRWVARVLVGALGLASAAELWSLLGGMASLSGLWRLLGRRRGGLRRVAVFVVLAGLVLLTRPRVGYDRVQHREGVASACEQWLDAAEAMLAGGAPTGAADGAADRAMARIGEKIVDLHAAGADDLPAAARELIIEARNAGLSLPGEPAFGDQPPAERTFSWSHEQGERYETFGQIEPGQTVRVHREPVILDGQVRRRGLVRRVREEAGS